MAKRKRGRKPLKAGVAKSESLTMRLHPDMRRALEASARATGRTISVAAERLLHAGLTDIPDDPADGHLVSAIALLIKRITKDTQRSWAKDGYTAQSIRHAIDGLLFPSVTAIRSTSDTCIHNTSSGNFKRPSQRSRPLK